MRVILGALMLAAIPAMALARWHNPGSPAPAPDLANGLPAAIAVISAIAATRFKRRR